MSIILKRPMFRRGGSVEGGITSGLSKRTGFKNPQPMTVGNQANQDKVIEFLKSRIQEKKAEADRSRIPDFLTAFGSTAGKAKTFGEATGQAVGGAKALQLKRQEGIDKYSAAMDTQLLKMFAGDKSKLNSFLKTVEAYTDQIVNDPKYKGDRNKAYSDAFKKVYKDMYERSRATKTFADKVSDKAKIILSNEELKTSPLAGRAAEIAVKIDEGTIQVPGGYIGFIKATKSGISDISPQGDGKTASANTKKPGYSSSTFEQKYSIGQNYIDPVTQSVYQYQGKGTFKRVYP